MSPCLDFESPPSLIKPTRKKKSSSPARLKVIVCQWKAESMKTHQLFPIPIRHARKGHGAGNTPSPSFLGRRLGARGSNMPSSAPPDLKETFKLWEVESE
ncbi:hypothetical protein FRC03_007858 [Tulasnella sp. 419]|nr:hypothetical protein FRC03_007858 [Tulasnella sp. 419]